MVYKKLSRSEYLLRLEKGEEVFKVLENFCRKQRIKSGWLWMIGALENPTVAYFDLQRRKYIEKHLAGVFELVSGLGNASWLGKKPIFHIHAALSDRNYKAYGG